MGRGRRGGCCVRRGRRGLGSRSAWEGGDVRRGEEDGGGGAFLPGDLQVAEEEREGGGLEVERHGGLFFFLCWTGGLGKRRQAGKQVGMILLGWVVMRRGRRRDGTSDKSYTKASIYLIGAAQPDQKQ